MRPSLPVEVELPISLGLAKTVVAVPPGIPFWDAPSPGRVMKVLGA